METIQEFYAWENASRDTIDFKKIYVDIADDLVAGLLLSQIIYWHLPDKNGHPKLRVFKQGKYWLAKNRTDWWDEIRITPRQFDRAIQILKKRKIVETKIFKFNGDPTIHIHLNQDAFLNLLNSRLKEQAFLTKSEKPNSLNVNNDTDETGKSLTEITAQNTSEKTYNCAHDVIAFTSFLVNNGEVDEWVFNLIRYFVQEYERRTGEGHPWMKPRQIRKVCDRLEEYCEWDERDLEALVNRFFEEETQSDRRLSYFASEGLVRKYTSGY